MKRRSAFILMVLGIFLASGFVYAQATGGTSSGGKEATIEELYLQNIELRIIGEQAASADFEMKLLALANLQSMMDEGRLPEEAVKVLDYLAMEGIGRVIREGRLQVNNFPEVRRRACTILGQLGGEEAKDTLVKVLLTDNEPMVRSEAVYALGLIGLNENNEVTKAISWMVLQQDTTRPDNNFAFASLLALEKIASKNNGINDDEAFRAVVAIAQGNYIRDVKYKAREVLNSLRKY